MRRLLARVPIVAVVLAMLLSVPSCTKTVYVEVTPTSAANTSPSPNQTPMPTPMPTHLPQPTPTAAWPSPATSSCYIVLDSSAGPIGTSLTVYGLGFAPRAEVAVRFDNAPATIAPLAVEADGAGAVAFALLVPPVEDGMHRVDVTDGVNGATQAFRVQDQLLPNTTFERTVIESFLNDQRVNAILWEEWNIFDEWDSIVTLRYVNGTLGWEQFSVLERLLLDRVLRNWQDIVQVNPPQSLTTFWNEIARALTEFRVGDDGEVGWYSPLRAYWIDKSDDTSFDAWVELKTICALHGINMEWPLPPMIPYSAYVRGQ